MEDPWRARAFDGRRQQSSRAFDGRDPRSRACLRHVCRSLCMYCRDRPGGNVSSCFREASDEFEMKTCKQCVFNYSVVSKTCEMGGALENNNLRRQRHELLLSEFHHTVIGGMRSFRRPPLLFSYHRYEDGTFYSSQIGKSTAVLTVHAGFFPMKAPPESAGNT